MAYYTMQVCENGHVVEERLEEQTCEMAFCEECGAKNISACPTCGTSIKGEEIIGIATIGFEPEPPKYCYKCGDPFPWTRASLEALKELAELDDSLDEGDVKDLAVSAEEILSETPKTKVAAIRFKKILSRAGSETATAARELFVDIVAETAKRTIWPN